MLVASLRFAAGRGLHSFSHSSLVNAAHGSQLSIPLKTAVRTFAREARFVNRSGLGVKQGTKTRSWKDIIMQPTSGAPFAAGQVFLAGSSAVALGALAYYGLGLSSQTGAIEHMGMWPQYVRDRIHSTYAYFGGSLVLTAAAAVQVARTPVLMNLVMRSGWMSLIATFAAMIGTGALCRSMEYTGSVSAKHAAWALHCAVMGAIVAPLTLLGGPIMMRAAWMTAGVVGGLSTVAVCAPSEKFLNMGGVLGAGLGVVLVSSIGTWFLPPTTALGAGLYSVALYGGLALFGAFLLYDTQRVIKIAEAYPPNAVKKFDPINACLSIYLDTLNIFIRIAMMLAGGGSRRK